MKVCRRCKKEEPDKLFRSYEAQGYLCVRVHCKPCERAIARERYDALMARPGEREKRRAYDEHYREKHRQRIRDRMRKYMRQWRKDQARIRAMEAPAKPVAPQGISAAEAKRVTKRAKKVDTRWI